MNPAAAPRTLPADAITAEAPVRIDPRLAGHVFCDWCGRPTPLDYAHGHAQCLHCKTNIMPCCDGATACRPLDPAPASYVPRERAAPR